MVRQVFPALSHACNIFFHTPFLSVHLMPFYRFQRNLQSDIACRIIAPLCQGLRTREASNYLRLIVLSHFSASSSSISDRHLDTLEILQRRCSRILWGHLSFQHFCEECACRAHGSAVTPHLAFKHFQFTADTHWKKEAGGKISNISHPLISSFSPWRDHSCQEKYFVGAEYLLLFQDPIPLQLTPFTRSFSYPLIWQISQILLQENKVISSTWLCNWWKSAKMHAAVDKRKGEKRIEVQNISWKAPTT